MEFEKLAIPEVILVKPSILQDPRGSFLESYHQKKFQVGGITTGFCQINQSSSAQGVLRGLHYQVEPHAQAKLVQVLAGQVFDVAVDLRPASPTYKKWVAAFLSAENKHQLFIPTGFAHGFYVLSAEAVLQYQCSAHYNKEADRVIRWDDQAFKIVWPLIEGQEIRLSEKDKTAGFWDK